MGEVLTVVNKAISTYGESMSGVKTYPVAVEAASRTHISPNRYLEMYQRSVEDPEGFGGSRPKNSLPFN